MHTSRQTHEREYEEVSRRREATLDMGMFPILVCKNERYWILDHFDRKILTRAEWLEIRERVDAFYDTYSDQAVAEYNEPVQQLRDAEAARYGQEAKRVKPPKSGYIYLIHGMETSWYKIGQSVSPKIRRTQLGTQGPFKCSLVHSFAVDDMDGAERVLHDTFADKRVQGEWFALDASEVERIRSLNCRTLSDLIDAIDFVGGGSDGR